MSTLSWKNCLLPSLLIFLVLHVVLTGGLEPAVVCGVEAEAAGVRVEVDGVHLVLLHLGAQHLQHRHQVEHEPVPRHLPLVGLQLLPLAVPDEGGV